VHNLKEYHSHGEAGSVDLKEVEADRKRIALILATYSAADRFNLDETSLFALYVFQYFSVVILTLARSAPPDRGLTLQQMSGKKKEKFCLTIALLCNADGSKFFPPIYIGKSKRPHCFRPDTRSKRVLLSKQ